MELYNLVEDQALSPQKTRTFADKVKKKQFKTRVNISNNTDNSDSNGSDSDYSEKPVKKNKKKKSVATKHKAINNNMHDSDNGEILSQTVTTTTETVTLKSPGKNVRELTTSSFKTVTKIVPEKNPSPNADKFVDKQAVEKAFNHVQATTLEEPQIKTEESVSEVTSETTTRPKKKSKRTPHFFSSSPPF
jgi:hypothetical protein